MSEDGRKQQEKLKELAHIAEKLECTLPQLAIGEDIKVHNKHSLIQCTSSKNTPKKFFPFSLVLEKWGSELSASGILQSKPAYGEPGSHSGTTHMSEPEGLSQSFC